MGPSPQLTVSASTCEPSYSRQTSTWQLLGDQDQRIHVTPVGFEPTQLALVELESTPLDHSGKVSC